MTGVQTCALPISAFVQNEWNWRNVDLYYAARMTYTSFQREGLMANGRAEYFQDLYAGIYKSSVFNSYGKGKETYFLTPSFKLGATYKIDGRNRITVNALAEERAPLANNSYVSIRVMDRQIPNLKVEKILSYDVNYEFNYRRIRGRISAFQTNFKDCSENNGYYDDTYQTFINQTLTGIEKRYRGIEAAATLKLTSMFSLTAAGSYGEYQYTSNAISILSSENGSLEQEVGAANINTLNERVYIKGLYTNQGPQLAASLALNFTGPKMWFAEIKGSYFDNSYIDFNPNRYTKTAFERYNTSIKSIATNSNYTNAEKQRLMNGVSALSDQEKFDPGFMVDVSFGKILYFNNRAQSLNINVSANNILNNTEMKTGGYQQARLPLKDGNIDVNGLGKFPNKYYYAQGFNFFINLGYRF